MALTAGSIMKPQEIKNLFVANVTNRIMNGVTDAAAFTSKVLIGVDGANRHEIDVNVRSVPQGDTISIAEKTNEINNIPMPTNGNYISGKALYKALVSTMSRMGTVRVYTSRWYHQEESEFKLIQEKSGKTAFKDRLSDLTPPEKADNVYFASVRGDSEKINAGWERSTAIASQSLSVPANPFTDGTIMKPAQVTSLLDKIYNAWAAVTNNRIEYKFYSCHSNCHASCHGSRSRR